MKMHCKVIKNCPQKAWAGLAHARIFPRSHALYTMRNRNLSQSIFLGAFVLFSLAVMAKAQIIVGIPLEYVARYYLLYAAFLLLAVLLWSIAFLHTDKTLKVIGSIGLLASFLPILAIVVGHVVVGFGATLGAGAGAGALLSAMEGGNTADLSFVITVERIFGVWAYVAAF